MLTALAFAQTPPANSGPPITAPKDQLLEIIGYVIGERGQLNIGYSDDELESILTGIRRYANGEARPENFEELIPQAQRLYFERVGEYREKQDAVRAEQAALNRTASNAFLAQLDQSAGIMQTGSGLRYEILKAGSDEKAALGNTVTVNYRGTRIDGTEFDAGEGADFPLQSRGGLIDGFKEGLQLIGKGGEIKLYIPPDLAYGDNPRPGGVSEPGDALIFEVELVDIQETPAPPQMPNLPPNFKPPGPPPSAPPPGPPPPAPTNLPPPPPNAASGG